MKRVVIFILFLTLLGCSAMQEPGYIVQRGFKSLVFVKISKDGHKYIGSGCVLNKEQGLILTNKHMAPYGAKVTISNDYGKSKAEIIYNHKTLDVAVVKVYKKAFLKYTRNIEFSLGLDKQGEYVYVLGNPLGFKRTVTSGIISNYYKTDIIIDVQVNPGNSGGMLLNSNGEFVGLIYAMDIRMLDIFSRYKSGLGYAIHGQKIKNIMKFYRFID